VNHEHNQLVPSSTGCLLYTKVTKQDIKNIIRKYEDVLDRYNHFNIYVNKLVYQVPKKVAGIFPYGCERQWNEQAVKEYTQDYLVVFTNHPDDDCNKDPWVVFSKKGLELQALRRMMYLYESGMGIYLSSHQCEIIYELRNENLIGGGE